VSHYTYARSIRTTRGREAPTTAGHVDGTADIYTLMPAWDASSPGPNLISLLESAGAVEQLMSYEPSAHLAHRIPTGLGMGKAYSWPLWLEPSAHTDLVRSQAGATLGARGIRRVLYCFNTIMIILIMRKVDTVIMMIMNEMIA